MKQDIMWEGDTPQGHYQIIDTIYDGRPARVLYSGHRRAAQSGIAQDEERDLLFDYNQRLFELITNIVPQRLLLIGGAVATLPIALLEALPDIRIDMVEPDAKLVELAHMYFDLPETERLKVYFTDGASYLKHHSTTYDCIVVDAFAHTTIPMSLRTADAFSLYAQRLKPEGTFAMNIISSYRGNGSQVLGEIYAAAGTRFSHLELLLASRGYSLWLPQNFVLGARNKSDMTLRDYVRHDAVEPPVLRRATD